MLTMRAAIKTRVEGREEENKKDGKELKELDEAILLKFDNEGVSSMKVPGLGNFISQERTFASIKGDMKDEAIVAFEEHYPDLVKKTINSQTLGAFVREARKQGTTLPENITKCVNEYNTRFIMWRRG